jgi:hypothetical protein
MKKTKFVKTAIALLLSYSKISLWSIIGVPISKEWEWKHSEWRRGAQPKFI